jgi:hypothetical protein
MRKNLDTSEAAQLLIPRLNKEIEEKFTQLLEEKHLYQRVTIDGDKVIADLRAHVLSSYQDHFDQATRGVSTMAFNLAVSIVADPSPGILGRVPLVLLLKNVTMFCQRSTCNRREAFRPIWFSDVVQQLRPLAPAKVHRLPLPGSFQVFVLAYQCQHCEGQPEVLIVRRSGWHLSLEGRSPMASVEIASFIPKRESHFFRDAIVATGAGKTLAGLFYLRTFIEQFGRRMTGISDKRTGDEILSEYAKGLPLSFRDSMPSLADWYEKLSVAIHSADPDEGLFKNAKEKIEKHFEIRKAMDLAEVPAKTSGANSEEASATPATEAVDASS